VYDQQTLMGHPPTVTARRLLGLAMLVAWGAAASCTPLPPQGGIDVGEKSDQWTVRFDPALGSPVSLVNRSLDSSRESGPPPTDEAAEAAVRAVIRSRPQWFHLRSGVDDFRRVRSEPRGWLRYLRMAQTYQGLPVAGAGYDVRVLPNGRVGSLEGSFRPGLSLDTHPVLNALQAQDRARVLVQNGSPPALPPVQYELENGLVGPQVLLVMPASGDYRLAWGVVVPVGARDHARVYIDARDGTPLGSQMVGGYVDLR